MIGAADAFIERIRIILQFFSLLEEKDKMERKVNIMGGGDKKDD